MDRSRKLKPENIGKLQMEGNWVKSDEQFKRLLAEQALAIAKEQEAAKIASGEYKYLLVPATNIRKAYRTLVKIK